MKICKMRLALITFCIVVLLGTGVHAGMANYICDVVSAGPIGDEYKVVIKIKDDNNRIKRCYAKQGREKEMLAVALAAMSSKTKVKVRVDWDEYDPELAYILLMPE